MPEELQAFHLASPNERRRRIRRTLAAGFVIWRRGGISMVEAVREAGAGAATSEYALRELRKLLGTLDLSGWESFPNRLRAEVSSAFKRAIGRITVHRGGWVVRHTRTHSRPD